MHDYLVKLIFINLIINVYLRQFCPSFDKIVNIIFHGYLEFCINSTHIEM